MTADTLTSLDDTILSVWTGTPGAFTQIACNDNAGTGPTQVLQSQVSFTATAGTTYYFMISSVLGDGGTAFHLRLTAATSATLTSIAVTPVNPSIGRADPTVHGDRDYSDNSTQNLTGSVTWTSGTPAVATISATGWLRRKLGTSKIRATSGAVNGSTTLTVTAATLVSIAVTPANPSIAKGRRSSSRRRAPTATTAPEPHGQVTWASATPAVATISAAGLATAVTGGTSQIKATAARGGLDDADGDGGDAGVDRGDAGESVDRQGSDAAVHGDGNLQRQQHAEPDGHGDVGSANAGGGDDQQRAGLATAVKVGTIEDHGDVRRRDGLDDVDGDGGDAGVDRGDAGESVDRQGATQQFTATGTYTDNSTQNLTAVGDVGSANAGGGDDHARRAWRRV